MPPPPSVDITFLEEQIIASGKILAGSKVKVGATTTFVLDGKQPLHRRNILLRELSPGQVNYEQAVALAYRFGFLGTLLQWLQDYRDYKEGGYVVPNRQTT